MFVRRAATSAVVACLALASARVGRAQTPSESRALAPSVRALESTGTSWSPLAPMPGLHRQLGVWTVMVHGDAVGQALVDTGSMHHRGRGVSSVNWLMASVSRAVPGGQVTVRAMASAEPWTMTGCGYPDMLATGEVCDGDSIHDRQHPHDVVMELVASYDRPLSRRVRLRLYGGPVGEPALGPTAFLHRASAAGNPVAPISHHWLDSSHVTFGVATAAVYGQRWKVDGSVFNGREPDDRRRNIEIGRWDAWSARATFAPTVRTIIQVSGGSLPGAEAGLGTLPRQDVSRLTASVSRVHETSTSLTWAATLGWGVRWGRVNTGYSMQGQVSHAVLAEATVNPPGPASWFGRIEVVGKPAHDLHAEEFVPAVFTVGKIQLGYLRELAARRGLLLSAGASVSAGLLPPLLAPRYDGRVAPGAGVFLRLSPSAARATHDAAHEHGR